jgi:hypothetical protein
MTLDAGSRHNDPGFLCAQLPQDPELKSYLVSAALHLTVAGDVRAGRTPSVRRAELSVISLRREQHSYIYDFFAPCGVTPPRIGRVISASLKPKGLGLSSKYR